MGAWGVLAFDNDQACDWASDLDGVEDLSLVISTLAVLENSTAGRLDAHAACNALAACEVLARLRGNHGYTNPYTEDVDTWAAAHPIVPPPSLLDRGDAVIDQVLSERSELRELWDVGDGAEWRQSVEDLRHRLRR